MKKIDSSFDDTLKKSEGSYKSGIKDGDWIEWSTEGNILVNIIYKNGQKWSEGNYKNGKVDRSFTFWYENGQKQREESYKNDERHGKWIYWFDNGRLEKEEKYSDGVQTDGKHYDYFDN